MLKRLKSFKLAETVVESTKLSTSTSELKKEIIENSFSPIPAEKSSKSSKSKYASFFNDKEVKMEGIFPLPKKRVMKPRWNSKACFQIVVADSLSDWSRGFEIECPYHFETPFKSDIPEMFFKAKENISPHDFKYVRNPYEFCTDVDQVDLLVMIASASWQFDRRKIIRETWATQTGNGKVGFKVFDKNACYM